MGTVRTHDGASLHLEGRGNGPLVVLVPGLWSHPSVFHRLLDDLVEDHRVVTYDPRASGRSSGRGPYDLATDARDLAAVLAAEASPATVLAAGPGAIIALYALELAPELFAAVVCPAGSPVNRLAAEGGDGFAGSPSVMDLLVEMSQRDYRGMLRNVIASSNPQLDEAQLRERLALIEDYTPRTALLARSQAWLDDNPLAVSRAAGDRLWLILHATDQWAPANAVSATRKLLPKAHIVAVDEGALSRPDLTAAVVRRVTGTSA